MPVFAFLTPKAEKEPEIWSPAGILAFAIFLLQGIGVLLPWNALISVSLRLQL